ncbi:MAG: sigma 54-interacting transcriptional regulator, partial [Candidatus Hydrogenedentales bacterium]
MRPTKLSSNVFLELPPVLAHYIEAERHLWVEGNPKKGRLNLLNRSGTFCDLESMAVERRHLMHLLGPERARALRYRTGFEQGRREGARHYQMFDENARLALQAALVFNQLNGRFVGHPHKFEFDLDGRTLYREVVLEACLEGLVHKMVMAEPGQCVCWSTAGYLSGHVSEILGRRVITMETECIAHGDPHCRFVSKLDAEWGEEAEWVRTAMTMPSVDEELRDRETQAAQATKAAQKAQLSLGNLNRKVRSEMLMDTVLADSEAMATVSQRTKQLMNSDGAVLLVGEAGTGKETVARSIHHGSLRKSKPFVIVDCTGLTDRLLNQELVGYEPGAIPGVGHGHKGAFARAHGGTLYLNDVTALTPEAQGHLLRVLNEGHVLPIGAEKPVKADIRVMAASTQDPQEAREEGTLREDLYYVLAIGRIDLPPLRERKEDIIRLAEAFLQEFKERHDRPNVTMAHDFKQILLDCAWPGNL